MHSHYTLPWEKKDAVYSSRPTGSAKFIFPYKWRPVLLTFFQLRLDLFIFTHLQEMGIFQSIILSPGKQFVSLNHGQRQISHSLHMLPQKVCFIVVTLVAKGFTKPHSANSASWTFSGRHEKLVKPHTQTAGTPLWDVELMKLSLFPAGTPCIDAELRGWIQYF